MSYLEGQSFKDSCNVCFCKRGKLICSKRKCETAEKPGVCPSSEVNIGMCAEFCATDSTCPGAQKCCSNGCGHQCLEPKINTSEFNQYLISTQALKSQTLVLPYSLDLAVYDNIHVKRWLHLLHLRQVVVDVKCITFLKSWFMFQSTVVCSSYNNGRLKTNEFDLNISFANILKKLQDIKLVYV